MATETPSGFQPDDTQAILELWVRALNSNAPDHLWHYTTAEGLLGILRSGAVWATGLEYLNDTSEGQRLAPLMLKHLRAQLPGTDFKAFMGFLGELSSSDTSVGVACFTAADDHLGQWRAYGSGHGYAIQFDFKHLERVWTLEQREGLLSQAEYTEESAARAARHQVNQLVDAWNSAFPKGISDTVRGYKSREDVPEEVRQLIARSLFQVSQATSPLLISRVFHKDPHFAEEQEWRLVTTLSRATSFRVRNHGLVPYREVPFQQTPEESPIRAIRIGPGLDFDSQAKSVAMVLRQLGYHDIDLLRSSVPLRPSN